MFFSRCWALVAVGVMTLASSAHASGGTSPFPWVGPFPPPPPDPPGAAGAFDVPRKPPVPVSFLSSDGGWIEFQYPPSARDRIAPLTAQADELRAELTETLGQTPLEGVEVRVARGSEEMSTLAPQASPPDSQQSSFTYPKLKLIVLSLGGTDPVDLLGAFRYELARLALSAAVGSGTVPAWFSEGFATRLTNDGEWARDWRLYRAVLGRRTHPPNEFAWAFDKGGAPRELVTAEASDFVSFLLKPERSAKFAIAVDRLRQGDDLEAALRVGYGADMTALARDWRSELGRRVTIATIFTILGVPGGAFLGWTLVRAAKRRRSAAAAKPKVRKAARLKSAAEKARIHIVLSRREERAERLMPPEPDVPKVEHEGEWHTLH